MIRFINKLLWLLCGELTLWVRLYAYNPATQEAEIRRITVQSQPRQIVDKTLSQKNST
jgi:hypothetical protein